MKFTSVALIVAAASQLLYAAPVASPAEVDDVPTLPKLPMKPDLGPPLYAEGFTPPTTPPPRTPRTIQCWSEPWIFFRDFNFLLNAFGDETVACAEFRITLEKNCGGKAISNWGCTYAPGAGNAQAKFRFSKGKTGCVEQSAVEVSKGDVKEVSCPSGGGKLGYLG